MDITLNLNSKEYKDLESYCKLNNLKVEDIVKKSYLEGFSIEKYGLLGKTGGEQEKRVEIEVIREKLVEIPVEVIKEVIKVEYVEVPVEKIIEKEIIVEVPVEKVVTNVEYICDNSQTDELIKKVNDLEFEKNLLLLKVSELENKPERVIEKEIVDNSLKPKLDALQNTVQKLREEILNKDRLIKEYEKTIQDIQKFQEEKKAMFLRGSNLDDNLYK